MGSSVTLVFVEEIEREKTALIAEIKNMSNEEIELFYHFISYMKNTKRKWEKIEENTLGESSESHDGK